MLSYKEAKANAMRLQPDWNSRTKIAYAVITWYDADYEYKLKISNSHMSDKAFRAYIIENAEEFARESAASHNLEFEGIAAVDYIEGYINDDDAFDEDYAAACEHEWELNNNR